jgi:hypothetical protein
MNTFLHSHNVAKKLNNSAALCIETGHYERGIACLVEALQLSDSQQNALSMTSQQTNDLAASVCQCRHCSLDECILFSERTCLHQNNSCNGNDYRYQSEEREKGYVYRRPIRITPQSIHERHNMGITLSLIITFNLALAHHLSNLDDTGKRNTEQQCDSTDVDVGDNSDIRNANFQQILQLYELAYRWQMKLEEDHIRKEKEKQELDCSYLPFETSPVNSLGFHMIIINNLSQIHLLAQNHSKHQRCLEHLLATIMFVVTTDGNTISEPQPQQQRYIDFDGFLLNASLLILQGQAAGAA